MRAAEFIIEATPKASARMRKDGDQTIAKLKKKYTGKQIAYFIGKKAKSWDPDAAKMFQDMWNSGERDLDKLWFSTKTTMLKNGSLRQERSDAGSKWKVDINKIDGGKLGNVMHHPKLFADYPGIENMNVKFVDKLPRGTGMYQDKSQTMTISRASPAPKKSAHHEITHHVETSIEKDIIGIWQKKQEEIARKQGTSSRYQYDANTSELLAHLAARRSEYDQSTIDISPPPVQGSRHDPKTINWVNPDETFGTGDNPNYDPKYTKRYTDMGEPLAPVKPTPKKQHTPTPSTFGDN